jgi:hypothetical protein
MVVEVRKYADTLLSGTVGREWRERGHALLNEAADALARRLQAAQPPPSTTCPVCNAEFATADQIDANARRAAQPVAPQEPVVTVEITPLESGGQSVLLSEELMSLPPGKHSLYLAPTPQGDSGQRDRLVAAISGKVYTKAFREEVLALFDASLPPDLGDYALFDRTQPLGVTSREDTQAGGCHGIAKGRALVHTDDSFPYRRRWVWDGSRRFRS